MTRPTAIRERRMLERVERANVSVSAAGAHCFASVQLRDTARAIRADALLLKQRAQEARDARPLRRGRRRDVPLVVETLMDGHGPLCAACISRKTDVSLPRVHTLLAQLARCFATVAREGTCKACVKHATVHGLE